MFTVLGASGFVGGALVADLNAKGEFVFAPDRNDHALFEKELGHVIYAIGLTADFRSRPYETMRAHVAVLADVLEKCAFQSFTYLSSTRVYGRCASGSTDNILKVDPSDPSDLYNLSKLAGESLSLNCGRPNTRVVRISNVVGHTKAQSDNFLDSAIRDAIKGEVLIRSAPESEKDYIALSDVVKAIPLIASAGRASIYNLASGSNTSNREITDLIEKILGCKIGYLPNAPILSFPPISISNLKDEFAFQPKRMLSCLPDYIKEAMSTI